MINKLYEAVAAGLKAVKECQVYREDVPQKFKRPSFLVTIYDQDPSRGINGRLKNSVSMDVLYFPESRTDLREECWNIGQDLTREFEPPGFKIKNRNLKIEDQVLHFMFDTDYREYLEPDHTPMQDVYKRQKLEKPEKKRLRYCGKKDMKL